LYKNLYKVRKCCNVENSSLSFFELSRYNARYSGSARLAISWERPLRR